jgi:hypothetical protein
MPIVLFLTILTSTIPLRRLPVLLAAACAAPPHAAPAPFGVAWGMLYGVPPGAPRTFRPEARRLGASFVRVNLLWSQREPAPGELRWDDLDAVLAQVDRRDDVILTLLAASPWATRVPAWVFPSFPARRAEDYDRFVRAVVAHARGRITYFQAESESAHPMFWAGTARDYVEHLRRFHRAVKETDPAAQVVLGGSDRLFAPPGAHPIPSQARSLAFVDDVLRAAPDQFDVFDLHLYADPYTIPGRIEMIRQRTARPIICTEYNGPGFFELPANRRHAALLGGLATGAASPGVAALYAHADALAPETRRFLADPPPALALRLHHAQARDLVIRDVLALASGVQRMAFWDLWHDSAQRGTVTTLLHGTLELVELSGDRVIARHPLADAFARMTSQLAGVAGLHRLATAPAIFAFETRDRRLVAWQRGDLLRDDIAAVPLELPWPHATAVAIAALGQVVRTDVRAGHVRLAVSNTPIYVHVGPPTGVVNSRR